MDIHERWGGSQSLLARLGESGCLFLSLVSIAEQSRGKSLDVLDAARRCIRKKLVRADNFFVFDSPGVLTELTGRPWTLERRADVPDPLPENVWTVEKWAMNGRTHFKRRGFDTIEGGARTVRDGRREAVYCYTAGGAGGE